MFLDIHKKQVRMNYLWGIMIIIGVVYGALSGNLAAVSEQALSSAKEAVTLCITMAGIMAFWVGMMEIAEDIGLIRSLSRKLTPVLTFLFPDLPKEHPARPHIATNIIANIFGLGWAATPAGLEAMKALNKEESETQGVATDTMCDFLILNISSLQIIPVNIIAYRSQYGSVNPAMITGPAILATLCSTAAAVLFIRLHHRLHRHF